MTQAELNRQVAQATGEDVATIAQRGFSLLEPDQEDCEAHMVDWDTLQANRHVTLVGQRHKSRVA
jgi:hypothetical protein